MKWALSFVVIVYSSTLFATTNCQLFTNPESCLGRTPEALSGIEYGVHHGVSGTRWEGLDLADDEKKNIQMLYVNNRDNPFGLAIEISAYRNVIFHIRIPNASERFPVSQEDFELFKDIIKRTKTPESWTSKGSGYRRYENYDNGDVRIVLFYNAVVMNSRALGPPR